VGVKNDFSGFVVKNFFVKNYCKTTKTFVKILEKMFVKKRQKIPALFYRSSIELVLSTRYS
jgi:hypothetical protein